MPRYRNGAGTRPLQAHETRKSGTPATGSRQRKCECVDGCGFIMYCSRTAITRGAPSCPCGGLILPVDMADRMLSPHPLAGELVDGAYAEYRRGDMNAESARRRERDPLVDARYDRMVANRRGPVVAPGTADVAPVMAVRHVCGACHTFRAPTGPCKRCGDDRAPHVRESVNVPQPAGEDASCPF